MLFMGTAIVITAFPMLARIIEENHLMMDTPLGTLSLGVALSMMWRRVHPGIYAFVFLGDWSVSTDRAGGSLSLRGWYSGRCGLRSLDYCESLVRMATSPVGGTHLCAQRLDARSRIHHRHWDSRRLRSLSRWMRDSSRCCLAVAQRRIEPLTVVAACSVVLCVRRIENANGSRQSPWMILVTWSCYWWLVWERCRVLGCGPCKW